MLQNNIVVALKVEVHKLEKIQTLNVKLCEVTSCQNYWQAHLAILRVCRPEKPCQFFKAKVICYT